MSEKRVDLQKEVFNKLDYPRTINTTFTELSVPSVNDDLETQVTVESDHISSRNTHSIDHPQKLSGLLAGWVFAKMEYL